MLYRGLYTFSKDNEEPVTEAVSVPLPTDLVSFVKPLLHDSLGKIELLKSNG